MSVIDGVSHTASEKKFNQMFTMNVTKKGQINNTPPF